MNNKQLSFDYETRYGKTFTIVISIIATALAAVAIVWSCITQFRISFLLLLIIMLYYSISTIYYQCISSDIRYDDSHLYIRRSEVERVVPISSLQAARRKMYYFYVLSFDGHPDVVYRVPRFPSDKIHKELEEVLRLAGLWHGAKH